MSEFVTLAQTRLITGDDVDRNVIDEFTKNSYILENIPFHRAAAPSGGTALAYTYTRLVTQPSAAFRALGSDYTNAAEEVEQFTVVCKPFGGSFGIDRVLAASGAGAQVALNMAQKIKGAKALFSDAVINGDEGSNANAFDGLSVALTGSSTEFTGTYDWSSAGTNVLTDLDELLSAVDGVDGVAILGNTKSILKIQQAMRNAGYKTASEDAAGRKVRTYDGVPLVDLGAKAGSSDPIIANTTDEVSGDVTTDLYVVRFGLDGFHAVSPAGAPIVSTRMPNPDSDSAALVGWVEMTAAVALKSTKAAAVLRGVQIA